MTTFILYTSDAFSYNHSLLFNQITFTMTLTSNSFFDSGILSRSKQSMRNTIASTAG